MRRCAKANSVRFRTLSEGIPQLVWRAVDYGHWTWSSTQWSAFTAQTDLQSRGWGWLEPVHPDDRSGAREPWERTRRTGRFEADYRIRQAATGEFRWFQTRATSVRDMNGRILEWLGTSTDVQELREIQERQSVLVAELQHRTRTLMGVVQGVTDKTLSSSSSLTEIKQRFVTVSAR
nr:PAS domain-containing protein [Paracoccus albicereus]